MNRSSFGFILIACIYSISINTVVGFGAICTDNANCTDNGEVCDTSNSTCACNINDKYYYNGSHCDLDINECTASPNYCFTNADYANTPGSFTCACVTGYSGNRITCTDECTTSQGNCHENADCTNTPGSFTCACKTGYSGNGITCTDIDECSPTQNGCHNNANCTNIPGSFTCACKTGYSGNGITCTDIDECTPTQNSCHNNAYCTNIPGSFTCACKTGYSGNGIACTDIDECTLSESYCHNNAYCTNIPGSFTCVCKTGYSGNGITCTDIDECTLPQNNCHENADCTNTPGSFTCACKTGYSGNGITCTDIDECTLSQYNCHNNAYCTNIPGSFTCACKTGYSGNGITCTDIDECTLPQNNCHNNAYCTNIPGSFTCACKTGYSGNGITCTDIDDCYPNPCLNGGTCSDLVNDYSCTCKKGFSAKTCSVAALGAVCGQTGTTCLDTHAECRNECVCKSFYYDSDGTSNIAGTCLPSKILGKACRRLPNECKDSYAQCLDDKCTCESGYYDSNGFLEGGSCDIISNLQVKEIIFPTNLVTTSGFTVEWTPPDGTLASFVNIYEIGWRLKNNPDGLSKEIASTETSLVINTDVTAGKTYTVTVTSKNTQTQNDIARTISLSKEQAAKPNTPGAIDKGRSDLNASDGRITLFWGPSSGGVSGYKLTLSDGTNSEPYNPTSEYFTFSPRWLKNGFRYNVTIQAKSETFEGGKVVFGVEYREEIKTVVTEPTAPQSVACKEIFDESIILEWQSPSEPNGDLVRYTVYVYHSKQAYLFPKSTTGIAYTLKIKDLKPGTLYTFRVFTENERYNSTTYGKTDCQTKVKLSDPPSNLTVTLITSRNFTVHWDKPNNTYSEENYGYVIQTKIGEQCIKEVVYRCIDCRELFKLSTLDNMCPNSLRKVFNRTKDQLAGKQSWQFLSLLPDTMYTISGTAVNSAGRGNVAKITTITNEEATAYWNSRKLYGNHQDQKELRISLACPDHYLAQLWPLNVPQFPYSVAVSDITSTSFLVAWNIDGDRPGKTNFTVYITADSPARNKEITVTGFSTRSKLVENLEEYWNYVVSVEATTSLGSRKSLPTSTQRTLPAAPGQVSDFQITDAPGGNYTQMKVTWKAPGILQRNSIIKEYKFKYFSDENSMLSQSLQHETSDIHEYIVFVDVRPEQTYTVQVFAVNEEGQNGEATIESKSTPAGVPVNIEDTLQVNIISAYKMIDRIYGMFSVTIVLEFFEESTNGRVRATGLLACAKNCDFSRIKTLQDFNGLKNWKQASSNGFTLYRVTNLAWLTDIHVQTLTSGRMKRAVSSFIYTVGQDDCADAAPDEYCNGPLSPNTDIVLVAVSCTNGGCLLSKEYGPFSTVSAPKSTVKDCNSSTQTVIVGVVLGLIIIILSLYAGYVTILIRRYRARKDYSQEHTAKKRNRKEQLYVNELFTGRTAGFEGRPSNPATIRDPETEYSRLDDATREEKGVYDIIQAM